MNDALCTVLDQHRQAMSKPAVHVQACCAWQLAQACSPRDDLMLDRMIWSFARDKGIPMSAFFRKTSESTNTPLRTVWLSVLIAFVMGTPMVGSTTAFTAVVSIATIGLTIAYGIPIAIRLTIGRKIFVRGPFHLGRFSDVIGTVAVCWIAFSAINFCLPTGAKLQ